MPLKPVFDKAPLMAMSCQPLRAGLVRAESAAMHKLYAMNAYNDRPAALEATFRLACFVTAKPAEEPVAAKIRTYLAAQKTDGSFRMSLKDSISILRAAWALYEYEARKPLLEHVGRWCSYAVLHWDELMADDDIWAYSADLLELLENLYRVTGKSSVLTLCERLAEQSMSWSGVLNTASAQRPSNRTITRQELDEGLAKENGSRDGYYNHFLRSNHAEAMADGARSTMARSWYSGSATELNATRHGWERLYRYHGAVCGGLTSDELLEGTSPSEMISTAALGAWAEALSAAAMTDQAEWAWNALERMVYNAMPACIEEDRICAFQRLNTLKADVSPSDCFYAMNDHENRAMNRLMRGYAAIASCAVTARPNGAAFNLYLPGRYAIPMDDELMICNVSASAKGATISIHCKNEIKAAVRLRIPYWSKNVEVTVNGADYHNDVMNGIMTFDRVWHDGDVVELSFEQTLYVETGHHQGKYVLRGPVLMALSVDENNWRKALVSAAVENNRVTAMLETVKQWNCRNDIPADIPVLPETDGVQSVSVLTPYARTKSRIVLFPGRKQA